MLNTPFRRASFVVAIVGALMLCGGTYDWLTTYPNLLVNRTTSIPDYPQPDDQIIGRKAVVQIHRRCEWKDTPPPDVNVFDHRGPVMLADQIFSLDAPCASRLLDRVSYNRAGILLVASGRSQQLMLREALRDKWFWRNDKVESLSGQELYQRQMVSEMLKLGVLRDDASKVLSSCVKKEAKFCIEAQRYVYFNVWSVIWGTWPLAIGFVLFIAGLAGSVFLTQVAALWRISGGRVVNWIRRGS